MRYNGEVFDLLRFGILGGELAEVGFDHVGLGGGVDELLVATGFGVSGLLLAKGGDGEGDTTDGGDDTVHLVLSRL